jgi:phage shock protein C
MRERHHHHHHYHWRDDDRRARYAWSAGEPGPGPNHHRLRRNMARGKIAGVCAGLSDYFGVNVKLVRVAFILGAIFAFPLPIIAYGVAAIVMKPRGDMAPLYDSPEDERFWRSFSVRPKATYGELKHRFRALDARIAEMEHAVTSNEYALRREFKDLERGAS